MSYHGSHLTLRFTVIGSKGSGKTALVKKYIGNPDEQKPEKDCACVHNTVIEATKVTQQILDSDGKNTAVTAWAHGVIIVYGVDDREGFRRAEKLINTVKQLTMKDASIMLVANKVDIPVRQVSLIEGQQLASKYNCNYVELSALHNESKVKSVFYELSHEIIQKKGIKIKQQKHRKTPMMVRRLFQALKQNSGQNSSMTL